MPDSFSFPEKYLHHVWRLGQLSAFPLATADGRSVTVLEPGIPNNDGGPDFTDALVRIGGTLFRGDVELHLDAASWYTHGHDRDAHYNRVILHVAMISKDGALPARTASGRLVPLLLLGGIAPPGGWCFAGHQEDLLPCFTSNRAIPANTLRRWVHHRSRERIMEKACRFKARIHELAGERNADDGNDLRVRLLWEQLLFEGIMECLGYAKNRRPMLALARAMRLEILRLHGFDDTASMEALLFGAAGLLPSSRGLPDREARLYVRMLRKRWKGLRRSYTGPVLHEAEWLFFRLRPVNFPTARLAVMAQLLPMLFDGQGFRRLVKLARSADGGEQLRDDLCKLFAVRPGGFWRTSCHFRGSVNRGPAVLGRGRILDILVNAVIPVLLLYACTFDDRLVRRRVLQAYASVPLLQENAITIRMRRQLVRERFPVTKAMEQQGLLQIYKHYCAESRCEACVAGLQRKNGRE